jgi:prepilin-type N-terminal cleavage/methylation domain-containing protein
VTHTTIAARRTANGQSGFSLIELLVCVVVLSVVSATAMSGVLGLTKTSSTISNRTEMHAGVRNATELLQQEVGQAGRITLPSGITVTAPIAVGATTFQVSSVAGMWLGQYLVLDTGGDSGCTAGCEETVMVKTINGLQITIETDPAITKGHISFWNAHTSPVPVSIAGGFAYGVVPTAPGVVPVLPGVTNGSTGSVLKIFGDIDGNGNMVYIEYSCDVTTGNLYRRSVAYDSATKPPISADQSLLNNIIANPNGSACFTYQQKTVSGTTFVVDVAITLTVQTAVRDPLSGLFQKETKALLNVSPRNVFNVWQLAGLGMGYRVQPVPPSVTALLAMP